MSRVILITHTRPKSGTSASSPTASSLAAGTRRSFRICRFGVVGTVCPRSWCSWNTGTDKPHPTSDTAAWLETSRIPYMSLCFTGLKDSVGSHVFLEEAPPTLRIFERMASRSSSTTRTTTARLQGPASIPGTRASTRLSVIFGRLGSLSKAGGGVRGYCLWMPLRNRGCWYRLSA